MSLQVWLLFCATETVLCFTPGPAVLLVVSQSLAGGARAGVAASLGILAANAGYFALSATSLGAMIVASGELFSVIKWIGAVYLIWLGARMVFARQNPDTRPGTIPGSPVRHSRRGPFALAVLTQGANPKALVFFTAILPQFVNPAAPVLRQMLILGLTSVIIEFVVLSIYVATCHTARAWANKPRVAVVLQRLGGGCLIGAGARLAVMRRS